MVIDYKTADNVIQMGQASGKEVDMFKRSGIWWTCIRHNGRKIQKSLKTTDWKLAQKIEAKIRKEIIEGEYFEKPIWQQKTFKDMMDRFMKEHTHKVSFNMQSSYTTSLKHTIPFFGNSTLLSITPKIISKFKVQRKSEGAAPGSINRELSMVTKRLIW